MDDVEMKTFHCKDTLFGNKILIQKNQYGDLHICEVEVYGVEYEGTDICQC